MWPRIAAPLAGWRPLAEGGRVTTPSPWRGRTAIEALGPGFYEPVEAAAFPRATLRWRNDRAAGTIGLAALSDAAWVAHFARFEPLPDSLPRPLALAYHGHQFRHYNPNIGDGRGFLFAQGVARDGRLMDLGTKGSGRTPFSRSGDGRLTLKGAVREILATERLDALGVPTSRTLSVIETGEELMRGDEPRRPAPPCSSGSATGTSASAAFSGWRRPETRPACAR